MHNLKINSLPGGIKVITENLPHLQSFSLGFWFNTGTRDEETSNNGISHFIEHMLFKGTKKRSAKKISDEIESYGGYINAFTSKEHTCYYSRGLRKNISRTFKVLADMIQNPLFKESHIKKEAGVVIDELKDIDDNPEELIYDKFEEVIFKGSSLSLPVIGTEKNIKKFSTEELSKYHKKNYGSNNLLIVASGAVDHQKIIDLTNKFIAQSLSPAKVKRRGKFSFRSSSDLILEKDFQQVHTIIGRTSAGLHNSNRYKVKILSSLLGEGSSSRLFQAVREKLGITYQINSFLNSYDDVSAYGIYYSTNPNQANRVMEIIYREFKKLKSKPVHDKELKRVKEYLKGGILLSLESTTNRMIRMANSMLYYKRVIGIEEYLKKIDAVSAKDIISCAEELFEETKLVKVILKSANNSIVKAA